MIDLAAVAARINALPGWSADEFDDETGHYVTVMKDWEGLTVIVTPQGTVVDPDGVEDFMVLLAVLQIVKEAMAHE